MTIKTNWTSSNDNIDDIWYFDDYKNYQLMILMNIVMVLIIINLDNPTLKNKYMNKFKKNYNLSCDSLW